MSSRLVNVVVGSLIAMAVASPGVALAELTIKAPRDGSLINDPTPRFAGTTAYTLEELEELVGGERPVELEISGGGGVQRPTTASSNGEDWSAVAAPLGDGTYTAKATQTNLFSNQEKAQISFTVDATPPAVTMTTPSNGSSSIGTSELVGGAAGTASGDLPAITIQLYAGEAIGPQVPLVTLVVQASGESWAATLGGLGPGTYTAQATQRDQAGNTGSSAPVTFTLAEPPAAPPPVASFKWFPPSPRTDESVSLVSSSTDPASPITGFEWSLSSSGAFVAGKPVLTTSFATPGGHVVRLRVTDAAGRSSIATQTVPVIARRRILMQPFPIVRIAGSVTSSGARLRLLTVQAPLGARVTVACRGPGCKTKSVSRLATVSSKGKNNRPAGAVLLSFHRFERPLGAGAILKVLVSKPGEIGKYTSFVIRRHKLPVRKDACLATPGSKPMPCPTS
jgi:PKD domain